LFSLRVVSALSSRLSGRSGIFFPSFPRSKGIKKEPSGPLMLETSDTPSLYFLEKLPSFLARAGGQFFVEVFHRTFALPFQLVPSWSTEVRRLGSLPLNSPFSPLQPLISA